MNDTIMWIIIGIVAAIVLAIVIVNLVKIFKNSDKTVQGFLNELWNEIEI